MTKASRSTLILDTGDGEVEVQVLGLSRKEWAKVVEQHPPGTKDRVWNERTFPPALISACTGVDRATAANWWHEAPVSESTRLFEECLRLSAPNDAEWAVRRLMASSRTLAEVKAATRLGIPRSEFLGWNPDDQDWVIALMRVEADVCPGGCGVATSEMQNPTAYRTVVSRCTWCQQLNIARDEIPAEERGHRHVSLIHT